KGDYKPSGDRVLAVDLFDEYEKNEVAADQQYRGRWLSVTGTVKGIGKDIVRETYVVLGDNPDRIQGTQAFFAASNADEVATFSKGQRVTLLCRGAGKAVMNVILRECSIDR